MDYSPAYLTTSFDGHPLVVPPLAPPLSTSLAPSLTPALAPPIAPPLGTSVHAGIPQMGGEHLLNPAHHHHQHHLNDSSTAGSTPFYTGTNNGFYKSTQPQYSPHPPTHHQPREFPINPR